MDTIDTLEVGTIIMGLLGGLALFLFGMEQMSDALKTLAGSRMKNLLRRLTTNRFKAVFAGAFVTAIIQSSSVTTVLVVGFITAGLMSFQQSIGVILGAHIGTTITAQIVSLKITQYALVPVAIGFALLFFSKRKRTRQYGTMIMGLGLIFFGMELMGAATKPLRAYEPFIIMMQEIRNPLFAVLISTAFTAIVQSSSATTGLIVVLAGQGLITMETAVGLVYGANIGTCITALLAAIGKPREAVMAAVVHVTSNVLGVLIWLPFTDVLIEITRAVTVTASQSLLATPREVANAHTIFNLSNTLIFIWFTAPLAKFVEWVVPVRTTKLPERVQPRYLDDNLLATPDLALDLVRLELGRLGEYALKMVRRSLPVVLHGNDDDLQNLTHMDEDVDTLQAATVQYLGQLSQQELLNDQSRLLGNYLAVANYMENIGDMIETNLVEAGYERLKHDVTMSDGTQQAILLLAEKVSWTVENAVAAVLRSDPALAAEVIDAKGEINRLSDDIDSHLARRLIAAEPHRLAAFRIESDVIENYRRIYYFAKRIAKEVVDIGTIENIARNHSWTSPEAPDLVPA
ncbi:MAG: Na/Pi cotransporter family protein [Caldilineaceae bacterium]|nr:Na/Pi cotransporter family protein [Caldilineaceae bacterium]